MSKDNSDIPIYNYVGQAMVGILRLGGPLSVSLLLQSSLQLVTLAYAGTLGDTELAVAGLGQQLVLVAGLGMIFFGSSEALSTLATQAYGANRLDILPSIWQRAVLFNAFHALPVMGVLLSIPYLFTALGRDAAFNSTLATFLLQTLPLAALQGVMYPLQNMLIAQQRSLPIMFMTICGFGVHVLANHVLVSLLGLGLTGTAMALIISYCCMVGFLVSYTLIVGLGPQVWGRKLERPTAHQLREYASLGYSSTGMRAIEWGAYTFLTILAGFLPDPDVTQAAAAVGVEVVNIMFVPFMGLSLATTAAIGSELGAGEAAGAKTVARAAPLIHPFIILLLALLICIPPSRAYIVALLAKGGSPELQQSLSWVLQWLMFHIVFDGMQSLLGSILTGCGLQRIGLWVNLVAFPFMAMPLVYLLGKTLGLGLKGLFYGQIVAPIVQVAVFVVVICTIDWNKQVLIAQERSGAREPLLGDVLS